MRQETESSGSKAKTKGQAAGRVVCRPPAGKKTEKGNKKLKSAAKIRQAGERKLKTPKTLSVKQCKDRKQPEAEAGTAEQAPTISEKPNIQVSDLEFLDAVRDFVYCKLIEGELDLKIDSGFKAIELKNKLSDGSENENLLLKILSEIRKEELDRAQL